MVLAFKNSLSDELLVCEWVNSVDSRTYLNRRRWIDSERDTAVCPFISGVHGRAQQWHLIHQPQEYYWASWNRTKNRLYPSCIPFLLFSHPQSLLSTSFAECVMLVLVCLSVCPVLTSSALVFWGKNRGKDTDKVRLEKKVKGEGVKQKGKWQWECTKKMCVWGSEREQGKRQHSSCRPNSFLTQCLCSD